jgi:hypothetical protein
VEQLNKWSRRVTPYSEPSGCTQAVRTCQTCQKLQACSAATDLIMARVLPCSSSSFRLRQMWPCVVLQWSLPGTPWADQAVRMCIQCTNSTLCQPAFALGRLAVHFVPPASSSAPVHLRTHVEVMAGTSLGTRAQRDAVKLLLYACCLGI